jgi:hypothetical protein
MKQVRGESKAPQQGGQDDSSEEKKMTVGQVVAGVRGVMKTLTTATRGLSNKTFAFDRGRWILPPRLTTRLRYTNQYISSAVTSANQVYRFSAFDPDFTGAGAQPVGFDQLIALYQYFRVMKARGRCVGGSGTGAFILSLFASASSANPSTTNAVCGQPEFTTATCTGVNGVPVDVETPWIDIPAFFGLTAEEYRADNGFWGAVGADPINVVYFHLNYAWDGSTTMTVRTLEFVELELEFFLPVQLASS